ncbi:transglutaminase domain-containing protein [Planosporangium flavigriseum]|nr:transglutaminase domain-containing protein [Planosporangium flavigriseum]NJC65408.1 transglutaminase domain-containing protein [Planosporangium flavigriseum]
MLAIAGLALGRIYAGGLGPRMFLGAAVGAVIVSVAVRRLPSWSVAPLSVLALAGYTLLAVRLSAASGQIHGPLVTLTVDALRNGIPRVLTAMIPVEAQPDTVAVPVVATWLAGLTSAELALRARRVLLACTAPTLLYAVVLYTIGPNANAALWQPICFAGLVALALAASAGTRGGAAPNLTASQRHALRLRLALGTAASLTVSVGLVAAIGPSVAAGVHNRPTDPRRYVAPPRLDTLDENPLVRLSGWALNPDQHLFDARISGASADKYVTRLAVLNDYDGVTWRVGATYRSAGRVLTGPNATSAGGARSGRRGPAVTQQITIAELDGRLVPSVAVPERIDGVRVAFDETSGTIALPEGLRSGLRYEVVSQPPRTDGNLLPTADIPTGPGVARFVTLGGAAPPQIRRLSEQLTEGNGAPFARAQAIEQFLSEHYQLVADAPSGHAYPNLNFFLFGPRNGGGQRGTSEQFAAAFAVLGRLVGLPTRVVVGFRSPTSGTAVRGADAFAWPEVLFTGIGWVAFNPLPQPNTQPRPVEDDFKPKPEPSTPPPSTAPPASVAPSSAPPKPSAKAAPPAAATPPGTIAAAVVAGLFLALVLTVGLVVLLRTSQRRRRLHEGDPPRRIIGAWLEVLDALRLAGRPPPRHLAATEIAEHAARTADEQRTDEQLKSPIRPAAPGLDELAGLVNVVTFAPDGASAAQADQATAAALAYVEHLRARRSWWRRLLWSADPRPVWWGRGRR